MFLSLNTKALNRLCVMIIQVFRDIVTYNENSLFSRSLHVNKDKEVKYLLKFVENFNGI